MPNFAILLAPSDGKQEGGNPFAPDMFDYRSSNTFNYFNELNPSRRELIGALHRLGHVLDTQARVVPRGKTHPLGIGHARARPS